MFRCLGQPTGHIWGPRWPRVSKCSPFPGLREGGRAWHLCRRLPNMVGAGPCEQRGLGLWMSPRWGAVCGSSCVRPAAAGRHCRHPCSRLFEGETAGWRGEGGDQPRWPEWGSEPTSGHRSSGRTPPLCSPACVLQDGYTTDRVSLTGASRSGPKPAALPCNWIPLPQTHPLRVATVEVRLGSFSDSVEPPASVEDVPAATPPPAAAGPALWIVWGGVGCGGDSPRDFQLPAVLGTAALPSPPPPGKVARVPFPRHLGSHPSRDCPPLAVSKTDRYPTRNLLGGPIRLLTPVSCHAGGVRVWPGGRDGGGKALVETPRPQTGLCGWGLGGGRAEWGRSAQAVGVVFRGSCRVRTCPCPFPEALQWGRCP